MLGAHPSIRAEPCREVLVLEDWGAGDSVGIPTVGLRQFVLDEVLDDKLEVSRAGRGAKQLTVRTST